MDNIISEYQKWKQKGESLRVQARQAMEVRFRDLLLEAAQIGQEYQRDFGASLKPPATIVAFRYKTGLKAKVGPRKDAAPPVAKPAPGPVAAPSRRVAVLLRQRAGIEKKLEAAKTSNRPTRNLDDKLYEVNDELRLLGGAGLQ